MVRFHSSAIRGLLAVSLCVTVGIGRSQQVDPTNPFITGPIEKPSVPLTESVKDAVLHELSDAIVKESFVSGVDLAKWPEFLAKERTMIDHSQKDSEFARAINVAMDKFGISHIRFLSPRAANNRVRTSTVGIGVSAYQDRSGLVIGAVVPESPADLGGVRVGDHIETVDGKVPTAPDVLQGEIDTEITLKILPREGLEKEVHLRRARYSVVRPCKLSWIGTDVAVLKIWSFGKGYDRREVDDLLKKAHSARYLLVDLRNNAGGATGNCQHLLSLLMPEDTVIGTFVTRAVYDDYRIRHPSSNESDPVVIAKESPVRYRTHSVGAEPYTGKIAVLTNRTTASASEIVAWGLRENLHSIVVGSRTAGAVLAAVYHSLPYGFEVQYPISDYVTKNFVRLEKNPMVPDVEVAEQTNDPSDPVVNLAIEKLRKLTIER